MGLVWPISGMTRSDRNPSVVTSRWSANGVAVTSLTNTGRARSNAWVIGPGSSVSDSRSVSASPVVPLVATDVRVSPSRTNTAPELTANSAAPRVHSSRPISFGSLSAFMAAASSATLARKAAAFWTFVKSRAFSMSDAA